MITSARFVNIQRWKEVELNFHPGTNAIVGDTDAGKSALWRGLNWLFTNRPLGMETLLNWTGKEMMVEAELDGVGTVRRYRSKSRNFYQINDDKPFEGFGPSIPEPILKAFNMKDINFEHQKDQFFLLDSSASEVARALNEVANLQIIDQSLSRADKESRSVSGKLKNLESQIETLQASLAEYNYLDGMEEELGELEQYQSQADALQRKIKILNGLQSRWDGLEAQLGPLEIYRNADEDLSLLTQLASESKQVKSDCDRLSRLQALYQKLWSEQNACPDLDAAAKELVRMTGAFEEMKKAGLNTKRLKAMIDSFHTKQDLAADLSDDLGTLQKKWAKEMPESCRECWMLTDNLKEQ